MNRVLRAARRAGDDPRRDLRRHRRGGDRGLRRPAHRRLHPLSARAGVRRAAPADDDGRQAQRPRDRDRRLVRRLPGTSSRRCSAISPSATNSRLSGVNSINWARILAQIVYYFIAAVALGAPERRVSFAVPTGNFGDVLAGYYAKRMGLPVERLDRRHQRERHSRPRAGERALRALGVKPTQSPSMDIQVSSNFERLLFEASGRDAGGAARADGRAEAAGRFHDPAGRARAHPRRFRRLSRRREPTAPRRWRASIARAACVIDPHTAVGVHAARSALARDPATPVVALATAHPAKFPDAVERATGVRPPLPAHLLGFDGAPRKRSSHLPNDRRRCRRLSCGRLRGPPRERAADQPSLRARRRHRGDPPSAHRRDRRLRRRRLASSSATASTGCRICSSTWRSRARGGAARARSPRRSRMSAAISTPRPASSRPAISPACSARTSAWRST